MLSYELDLSTAAERDLKSLPERVQQDIVMVHLPAIRENPFKKGKPLSGVFHNERSYHFGRRPEYRIIYYLEGNTITVTVIGTREGIYKKARKRK
jgi:mRNA-degrading endonuclease RelE of RelBE toxin-antitoxin system